MKFTTFRIRALIGIVGLATSLLAQAQGDLTPPELSRHALSPFISKGAANKTSTRISVYFNEPMDEVSAKDISHYSFPGSSIVTARVAVSVKVLDDPLDPDGSFKTGATKVVLEVSPAPASQTAYSLTVRDIKDLAGNAMAAKLLTGTTPFYEVNLALTGVATQSSTPADADLNEFGSLDWHGSGSANLANDGDIDGFFNNGSVTMNKGPEDDGWLEVDLGTIQSIGRLQVWFRTLTADECQALFNSCGVRNDDFRLLILDGNRKEVFRHQYRGRPPGTVAFNLPPGIKGRHVRFEAQSPRTTSDGYFSLAEVAVIAPYENATIQVTQSPADLSVVENRTAKFGPVAATVSGAPADRLQVQWEVNGVAIEGASASNYTTPLAPLANNGAQYRAVFLLPGLSQPTAVATLKVTADPAPPTLQSVVGSSAHIYVTVTFSEPVRTQTAELVGNYQLDGGLTIVEVISLNASTVRLTTTAQTPGKTYTLTVKGVRDLAAGTGNSIAANSTKTFKASESDQARFVTVGNPKNPADQDYSNGSGAQGSVAYTYQIGKYEVNNTEYALFLNAKAKSDPNSLWDSGMQISRDGEDGSYSYTVKEGSEKKPAYMVAGVDAMRYVNWVNNGSRDSSDTETGTYVFTGYDVVGPRNPKADYFLPNENEWYKAAYYDPTKEGASSYWLYPNRTSNPAVLNYQEGAGNQFTLSFLSDTGGPPGPTDEDAYPLASSYYGTFSQAGNLWEWIELRTGDTRPRRGGGSWGNNAARVAASVRADNAIGNGGASINQGFRMARVFRPRPEFVTVGNLGNTADQDYSNGSGRQGAVNYEYQIGKYEVNNSDYAIFLNASAKTDPNSLWDGGMQITRDGDDGKYTYAVKEGGEKKPVYMVAAVDAIRFVNWLNNGAGESSATETGSYTLTGYDVVSPRTAEAQFVLPNEDEWYKAAYYDPTKDATGGYWLYPNRTSNAALLNYQEGSGNQFTLSFLSDTGGPSGPTDEDAYPLASSYYGTFSQAGNLWEWIELRTGDTRPRRGGGSWGNNAARVAASVRADNAIGNGGASINQGFRIAKVSPRSKLTILLQGNFVKLEWTGVGVLTASPSIQGPYTAVEGVTGSSALIPANLSQTRYFRIQ